MDEETDAYVFALEEEAAALWHATHEPDALEGDEDDDDEEYL